MKRSARLFLAFGLCFAASAPALGQDIVVTGKSLRQTEADLKSCLARKCPPDEDIKASLAHAENLFVSGDYKQSRTTLKSSIGRNRKNGSAYPVEVSDLFRANGRIAEQVGEARDYQLSILDMRDTLKKSFGDNDFRTLVAQIEVADSRAKLGYVGESERMYANVEKRALAANQPRVASFARLRNALMWRDRYDSEPNTANYDELQRRLDELIDRPLVGSNDFGLAAQIARAKVENKRGSGAGIDALIKRFAESGGVSRPMLLYSESLKRIDVVGGHAIPGGGFIDIRSSSNLLLRQTAIQERKQWADVGFWIDASGHVTDVEALRTVGDKSWLAPVLANIKNRIYAPLKTSGDATPGFYMIERYTLTARLETGNTGTHLRKREATPRIERIDLTPDNYEAPKQTKT